MTYDEYARRRAQQRRLHRYWRVETILFKARQVLLDVLVYGTAAHINTPIGPHRVPPWSIRLDAERVQLKGASNEAYGRGH